MYGKIDKEYLHAIERNERNMLMFMNAYGTRSMSESFAALTSGNSTPVADSFTAACSGIHHNHILLK